jgi:uncharacterized protein
MMHRQKNRREVQQSSRFSVRIFRSNPSTMVQGTELLVAGSVRQQQGHNGGRHALGWRFPYLRLQAGIRTYKFQMPRGRSARAYSRFTFTRLFVVVTTVVAALQVVVVLSSARCSARAAFVTSQVNLKNQGLFGSGTRAKVKDREREGVVFVVPNRDVRTMLGSSTSSAGSATTASEEIVVISQPDDDFLKRRGVFDWGTWGCGVSTFPWTYESSESCYLLAGTVTVTPADGRQPVTFGKARFVKEQR